MNYVRFYKDEYSFISRFCLQKKQQYSFKVQAPVVRKLDSAIHRINRDPAVKYYDNQLRYPPFEQLGPGVNLMKLLQV